MFYNSTPFGFSNNCGPLGGIPSNGAPLNGFGGASSPYLNGGFGGYNNFSNISNFGGGTSNFGGFGGFGFPNSVAGNSYGLGLSNGAPFGGNTIPGYNWLGGNNWNTPVNGYNNWNAPINGYNNWSQFAFGGQYAPLAGNTPVNGMSQGLGFPGSISNAAWMGYNTPSMNSSACFPGSSIGSPFTSPIASPISGVSNWFNSPWMGYASPNAVAQTNAVGVGNAPIGSPIGGPIANPINGQYIPTGGFPVPYAPFNVPFASNGCVPAGQGVNCEAA